MKMLSHEEVHCFFFNIFKKRQTFNSGISALIAEGCLADATSLKKDS